MTKKKIFFITGSRCDFGILRNLYDKTKNRKLIKSKIIVCGSHFDSKYGNSFNELIDNKIKDLIKIQIKLK